LLLYHVVADYEAEEDDKFLDSDTTCQMPSRLQQWHHNIVNKLAEFTTMFEKQVNTFNNLTHKQALRNYEKEQMMGRRLTERPRDRDVDGGDASSESKLVFEMLAHPILRE
ncbi:hypothetical protein IFM89_016938, partial [Coptis chinensis]